MGIGQRYSPIERALFYHEPIASSVLKYLAVHEVVILASTSHDLRSFLYSHSGYWRETNLCPVPPEAALNPQVLRRDGPTDRLDHWRQKLLVMYWAPYNRISDYELLEIFLRNLFLRNLASTVQVTRLVLDGLPIKRELFFEVTDRLSPSLRELSLRGCSRLEMCDFVDLLDFPEPHQTKHYPPNLKKLYCFGSVVYDHPYEARTTPPDRNSKKPWQLAISHFRSLLIARDVECDIASCSVCTEKLGLRGNEFCDRCGAVDTLVRCLECENAENARRRCTSCRRNFCGPCRGEIQGIPTPLGADGLFYCKECTDAVSWFSGCVKCDKPMVPATNYSLATNHAITGSIEDICGLCQRWMCSACRVDENPSEDMDSRWIVRQCTNCFNCICLDCGKRYSEENDQEVLNQPVVKEAISLREIYERLSGPSDQAQDLSMSLEGLSWVISNGHAKTMTLEQFNKFGPNAIRNLVMKRAETWKPLLAPCIECEEWWCWECRLRCTCPDSEEIPNGSTESTTSAEKTPDTVDWGDGDMGEEIPEDADSDEDYIYNEPKQFSCLVHNEAVRDIGSLNQHFCWSCGLWPREYMSEDEEIPKTPRPRTNGTGEYENEPEDEHMTSSDDWEWNSHQSHDSVASWDPQA